MEYQLNLAAAHAKARLKNEILPELQQQYERAVLEGTKLELVRAPDLLDRVMEEIVVHARS